MPMTAIGCCSMREKAGSSEEWACWSCGNQARCQENTVKTLSGVTRSHRYGSISTLLML
jgi:hypothetical protein